MYQALPHIISEEQTCNMKNRKIQYNLTTIRDIIEYAKGTNEKMSKISIDQKKAFDKVNWNFLQKTLN